MYQINGNRTRPFTGALEELLRQQVYKLGLDDFGFFFERQSDNMQVPEKLYEFKTKEFNYILNKMKIETKNVGVLFNGVKGTGKTLMGKMLSNALGLPVILIENFGTQNLDMFKFLANIEQDVVYFIDEFEKKFSQDEQQQLLSFMDGVYNNNNVKKIFIITTNNKNIDDNMISRPSRVIYTIEFTDFTSEEVIRAYFKDNLPEKDNNDEVINKLVKYLKRKENVTMDILSSIVREISQVGFEAFEEVGMDLFNIEDKELRYYCCSYRYIKDSKDVNNIKFSAEEFVQHARADFDDRKKLEEIARDARIKFTLKTKNVPRDSKEYADALKEYDEARKYLLLCKRIDDEMVDTYSDKNDISVGDDFDGYTVTSVEKVNDTVVVTVLYGNDTEGEEYKVYEIERESTFYRF